MCAREMLFTDALAVNIFSDSCFTAIGDRSYLLRGNSIFQVPHKLHYKKIHGFACSSKSDHGSLLLYSENEFSLFSYDLREKEIFQIAYEGETKDWINAALFFKDGKDCEFALHMAHSSLLRLEFQSSNNECCVLDQARCTDYSMLYHTSLYGDNYEKLIIISGNAFGEVLIWQPVEPVDSHTHIYPLGLRIKAHNGVIFAIDFNLKAQLLVTSSDDRSLKFWKVETDPQVKLSADSVKPMFSCFGHTARVTCATIAEYGGQIFVISGGEDSYLCVWNQAGEMLLKRRQQFGAAIWKLAFDPATATVYTTGSTGSILAYDLKRILGSQQTLPTQLAQVTSHNEFIKKIKYLTTKKVVGLSNKNQMFCMSLDESPNSQVWKLILGFPTYKCTVLNVYEGLIATCGYQRVTLLSYDADTGTFEQRYDGEQLEGLIQSFHFLRKDLYLISDEHGNCRLLKGDNMNVEGTIRISNGRESWITAALLVDSNCFLVSCRNGNVMALTRDTSDLKLKSTVKGLHGKMGSVVLKLLRVDNTYAYILSAGHESALRLLRLNFNDYQLSILQRQYVPLAWIEALPTADVLIGFNDNHLVAWSHKNDVILQLQCGGGHRCWDYQLNNEVLEIVYIKQHHVYHHREILDREKPDSVLKTLQSRWHIRTCNIMQLVENDSRSFIVSAGDDNVIKINELIGESLSPCTELHTHISSVRHLVIYPVKSENVLRFWLIFSVGGRSQLCVNKLEPVGPVAIELCRHILRPSDDANNALVDARLMSISVLENSKAGEFSLYVASSDGKIRLLRWELERPSQLVVHTTIDIGRCPLQMQSLSHLNLVLISTSNGVLFGFDETLSSKRFEQALHVAGINVLATFHEGSALHIVSGGDDESVIYTVVDTEGMSLISSAKLPVVHNAQIAAITLRFEQGPDRTRSELHAYTCSMDKQIHMINLRNMRCTRVGFSCISDIKGMILIKDQLFLYGCGLQVVALKSNLK